MTLLYFDCFAGASGDMLLAALLDAGAPFEAVSAELAKLPFDGYELLTSQVQKCGIAALDVTVKVDENQQPCRHFRDIEKMLEGSGLLPRVLEISLAVFRRLAEAEGKVHGKEPGEVHFHEVGAVDSIVDIVGIAAAIDALGATQIFASPLHVGTGFVRSAHGLLPVPAPATMELLENVPVYSRGVEGELLTPTGAAVLAVLARFGPLPAMRVKKTGYGAGKKELSFPNLLRVVVGEEDRAYTGLLQENIVIMEVNIDDMNPEFYGFILEQLFNAGALDAYFSPLQMKKNRPATLLQVLAKPENEKDILKILFRETTTLGIRRQTAAKLMLERTHVTVDTPYGPVRIKVGLWNGEQVNAAPEYEDCVALAKATGTPLKKVYTAAIAAYHLGSGLTD